MHLHQSVIVPVLVFLLRYAISLQCHLFSTITITCFLILYLDSVSAEVQFRHVPVKHDPFEDTHKPKCPTYKIDDADLEKALAHGHSIKDKIRSLEHELDLTRNVVNTTRISSTARHVIPSISKEQVRLLHHEQRAFEEASKVLAKKCVLNKSVYDSRSFFY